MSIRQTYRFSQKEFLARQFHDPGCGVPTYVYIMQCGRFHKVGMARDTAKRLQTIQNTTPFDVRLIARSLFDKTYIARIVERTIHEALREFRVQEEWFDVDERTVRGAHGAVGNAMRIWLRVKEDYPRWLARRDALLPVSGNGGE